jgi:hypothetical protein
MIKRHLFQILFSGFLLMPLHAGAQEMVNLVPDERSSWGATDIFAPITGFFLGGPSYWYKAREIEVETVPPGALLDLFYVRASFQKRYEQAEAPVVIRLPSRVQAGKRDRVMIRAKLDGYEQAEVTVAVRSRDEKVLIELEPVANTLFAISHTVLAGRGAVKFETKEPLTFRIQKRSNGFTLVLTATRFGLGAEEMAKGVSSPLVRSLQAQQLGEDLVVQVELADAASGDAVEIRSRQTSDRVRGRHAFTLDLVPADGGVVAVQRARAAFARLSRHALTGCALVYDRALRERTDAADLARALNPAGTFTDPFLREAMKRLGQLSPGGMVRLTDGSKFRVEAPIELAAAQSRAADAVGYLALLRSFVAELEPTGSRRATLRGLVAPELSAAEFEAIADEAEERERRCRSNKAVAGAVGRL